MNTIAKFSLVVASLAGLAVSSTAAQARPAGHAWAYHHPRQAEVLGRTHHQIRRINEERREGELSGQQARALRQNDRAIAAQDHADAQANGGYITRGEQRNLNAQLNDNSRAIGH